MVNVQDMSERNCAIIYVITNVQKLVRFHYDPYLVNKAPYKTFSYELDVFPLNWSVEM